MDFFQIESPQNGRIKAVARLRERRGRSQTGLYLIDGARECQRALQCGAPVQTLLVCPELQATGVGDSFDLNLAAEQVQRLQDGAELPWPNDVPVWILSLASFQKVAFGQRSDGVLAVARSQPHPLESLSLGANPLLAVVEAVEKPGNLGAIFRTADAVGVDALVIADPQAEPENPNVIRASLGTVFSVPFAVDSTSQVVNWLSEHRIQVVSARVETTTGYQAVDYRIPTAVVLGSEAHGLSEGWRRWETPVKIPMSGIADSLNVSVSAAVILYEALRQRNA